MIALNDNTTASLVSAYNDDVAEVQFQTVQNVASWDGQTTRTLMSDLITEAKNDNSPTRAA